MRDAVWIGATPLTLLREAQHRFEVGASLRVDAPTSFLTEPQCFAALVSACVGYVPMQGGEILMRITLARLGGG